MKSNWVPLCEHDSIYRLMNCFSFGCKAIPICNLKGDLLGIVTAADVLHFLNVHKDQLLPNDLLQKKCSEENCISNDIICLTDDFPTWSAFQLMLSKNQDAAPLVDKEGKLLGGLSFNYTKGLTKDNLSLLCKSAKIFVDSVFSNTWSGNTVAVDPPTFGGALDLLDNSPSHHIYVVDNKQHFVGLIFPDRFMASILSSLLDIQS